MLSVAGHILAGLAAAAAGAVNALAGGGTLITFPLLTALGVPAVDANVTNTVALCPGYIGATAAQSRDLKGQRRRVWMFVPAGLLGGIIGGVLLLSTGEALFRALVPYLILFATALLAFQDPLRAWVLRHSGTGGDSRASAEAGALLPVGLAAVYGGYFGAGMSVIVLAVLGLLLHDTLTRLNALKQAVAFSANIAAALFFVFSGHVVWSVAMVMAVGALAGGAVGGRLAGRVKPSTLRWIVVTIGVLVAGAYLARADTAAETHTTRFTTETVAAAGNEIYVLRDRSSGAQAGIWPSAGNNCTLLRLSDRAGRVNDVIGSTATMTRRPWGGTSCGIPVLFPWTGMIPGGEYRFEGKTYRLTQAWRRSPGLRGVPRVARGSLRR